MQFKNANERALYRQTAAAVTAALVMVNPDAKPQAVAHMACEHAVANVHQLRTTEKTK